jgi:hypothetical protein
VVLFGLEIVQKQKSLFASSQNDVSRHSHGSFWNNCVIRLLFEFVHGKIDQRERNGFQEENWARILRKLKDLARCHIVQLLCRSTPTKVSYFFCLTNFLFSKLIFFLIEQSSLFKHYRSHLEYIHGLFGDKRREITNASQNIMINPRDSAFLLLKTDTRIAGTMRLSCL